MKRYVLVLISISSIWLMTTWLLGSWLVVNLPLAKADAIVVLAGGADYRERTVEAARLYRKGVSRRIVLTNDGVKGSWSNELKRNPYFVERAKWSLIENGVPETEIEIMPGVVESGFLTGTEIEAQMVVEYCIEAKLDSILLVTSSYHTRRALAIYEDLISTDDRFVALGISYSEQAGFALPNFFWWLSPYSWRNVASEYSKFAARMFD